MADAFDNVAQLSAWMEQTGVSLLELTGPRGTLRLVQDGQGVPAVLDEHAPPAAGLIVRAPGAGVFLDRHPMRLEPAVEHGAPVRAGSPLGFLRVGPLLTAIVAPQDGVVLEVLAAHGRLVGYGAPLFELDPDGSEAAS